MSAGGEGGHWFYRESQQNKQKFHFESSQIQEINEPNLSFRPTAEVSEGCPIFHKRGLRFRP